MSNETEERYKGLGEDPAKEQGGNKELPETKVGVGSTGAYHPDYTQYFSEMGLDPTLSPYQQRRTSIPPMEMRDYYPGLAPQDVVVGQTSTPMGTFSLISPGAPLFPFAVLDAIENQKDAENAKKLAEEFEPIKRGDIQHTENPNFDKGFVDYQFNKTNELIDKYVETYGSYGKARRHLLKSGELSELVEQFKADKELYDKSFNMATQIIDRSKKPDEHYVSPEVLKLAHDFNKTTWGEYENEEARYKQLNKLMGQLVTATGIEAGYSTFITRKSNEIVTNPEMERVLIKNMNGDPQIAKTNVEQLLNKIEVKGLGAFYSYDEHLLKNFINDIDNQYDVLYGATSNISEEYVPTKEQVRDYVIGNMYTQTTTTAASLRTDNVYEREAASQRTWEQKNQIVPLDTIKYTNQLGLEDEQTNIPVGKNGKHAVLTAGTFNKAITTGGKTVAAPKNNIEVVAVGRMKKGNEWVYYIAGYEQTKTTVTVTDKDGTQRQAEIYNRGNKMVYIPQNASTNNNITAHMTYNRMEYSGNVFDPNVTVNVLTKTPVQTVSVPVTVPAGMAGGTSGTQQPATTGGTSR